MQLNIDYMLNQPNILKKWLQKKPKRKAKKKYRGMFKIEILETKQVQEKMVSALEQIGQDQLSRGVSVLCWLATLVANVLWKPPWIW